MRKYTKLLKQVSLIILIGFITYYGGGEKYIDEGISYVGGKIAELITGEPYEIGDISNKDQLQGKIVHVSDGDTVTLEDEEGNRHKIRLNGIDAPEIGQRYGDEAKEFVRKRTLNKYVVVDVIGIDQYSRVLGVLMVDNVNVNEALLQNGLAWKYRFNNDKTYTHLMQNAKDKALNIWSDPNAVDPYVWRKQQSK